MISSTINKYSYITVRYLPKVFDYRYRIRYFKTEETDSIDEIKHPSVRECAKHVGIEEGFEMAHNSDLPAGSGLGSSSTFTVGMLHSLYALKNYMPTKRELASNALHVEHNLIKEAVGSQDQVAAAWGGFNRIKFNHAVRSAKITINPLIFKGFCFLCSRKCSDSIFPISNTISHL